MSASEKSQLDTLRPQQADSAIHQMKPKPILQIRDLCVSFGQIKVLRDIGLEVMSCETLVILGGSGCGKTTFLRVLSGLLEPDGGEVRLDQQPLKTLSPRKHRIVYLDQESLMFEHLNVFENVAFSMRLRREGPDAVRQAVEEILTAVDLRDHALKRTWQLSGGQKQRVAFARAILARPRVLLLDEPFCSLDDRTRTSMQTLFRQLCDQYQMTALFVTHDVKEALIVGTRFALMNQHQLHLYPNRDSFIQDAATGIPEEIRFWKELQH